MKELTNHQKEIIKTFTGNYDLPMSKIAKRHDCSVSKVADTITRYLKSLKKRA